MADEDRGPTMLEDSTGAHVINVGPHQANNHEPAELQTLPADLMNPSSVPSKSTISVGHGYLGVHCCICSQPQLQPRSQGRRRRRQEVPIIRSFRLRKWMHRFGSGTSLFPILPQPGSLSVSRRDQRGRQNTPCRQRHASVAGLASRKDPHDHLACLQMMYLP